MTGSNPRSARIPVQQLTTPPGTIPAAFAASSSTLSIPWVDSLDGKSATVLDYVDGKNREGSKFLGKSWVLKSIKTVKSAMICVAS